ncbi:hypothetical protein, partial [uncultured Marinobacter sp.]|uniref:hypothetical protein n=1 Tax=uncultured Marinobacter sp. TaxID=187379 RepID=UPI0032B1B2A8
KIKGFANKQPFFRSELQLKLALFATRVRRAPLGCAIGWNAWWPWRRAAMLSAARSLLVTQGFVPVVAATVGEVRIMDWRCEDMAHPGRQEAGAGTVAHP